MRDAKQRKSRLFQAIILGGCAMVAASACGEGFPQVRLDSGDGGTLGSGVTMDAGMIMPDAGAPDAGWPTTK